MPNLLFDRHRRLRNGWWILLFFALLAALVMPAQSWATARGTSVGVGWQALMALAATLACAVLRRDALWTSLGSPRSWPRGLAIGVALGSAVWLATALVLASAGSVRWSFNPGGIPWIVPGLLACAATAFAEELVFRGFVFQRLVEGIGAWPGQLLMAAYFVLNHWGNPGMHGATRAIATINIFAASLLFGLAWLRTRSLALPVGLHFALNATQGVLLGFGVSGHASTGVLLPHLEGAAWWTGGAFGLEASVPGTIVVLLALVAVARWRPRIVRPRIPLVEGIPRHRSGRGAVTPP